MTGRKYANLVAEALKAKENSHSPYSNKPAGVALDTDAGIFYGAVVDNCAYPNSVCATKAGLVNALESGASKINVIAVTGWREDGTPANICGCCREFLSECGDIRVVLHNSGQDCNSYVKTTVNELLPRIGLPAGTGALAPTELSSGRRNEKTEELDVNFTLNISQAENTSEEAVELMNAAIAACKNAYIPVSSFPVGAAVRTDAGVFTGANIECSVIGNGLCAERSTISKAISNGAKDITCLAVVCYKLEDYGRPCGGCRQGLVEWGEFPVYQIKLDQETKTYTYELASSFSILPNCFSPKCLC